ncbi:MAG: thiolase C-terminal domain-containing protein, partial [Nocardioides sp.]
FDVDGRFPMNTHGGLLSYGHCGVAGGMAHVAEVVTQLRHERGASQVAGCDVGYVHADGGVLSAHVGAVLRRSRR